MSTSFGLAIFLGTINLLVVCGNLFVLYILVSQKSLHTSTNTIVFSLTLSDFLLGCLILPFSIVQEFSNSWSFGTLWCQSWLSLDILFSTASIYNLLAISFDRYMAVKQPIKYGRLISSSRLTKFTISAVWLISGCLAVPPFISDLFLVTASREQMDALLESNYSNAFLEFAGTCTPVTNSDMYILFSATVSFILPMILMVGLNASIFCTVLDSKRKLSQATSSAFPGRSTSILLGNGSSAKQNLAASYDEMDCILRVHRGGSSRMPPISVNCISSETHLPSSGKARRPLKLLKLASPSLHPRHFHQPCSLPVPVHTASIPCEGQSLPSSRKQTLENYGHPVENGKLISVSNGLMMASKSLDGTMNLISLDSPPVRRDLCLSWHASKGARLVWMNRIRRIKMGHEQQQQQQKRSFHSLFSSRSPTFEHHPLQLPAQMALNMRRLLEQERLVRSMPAVRQPSIIERTADRSVWFPAVVTSLFAGSQKRSATACRRQSERLLLYPTLQFAKTSLRTELRVARTIAVVVGCFTCCWLPFTLIYVLQAFQLCSVGQCIPDWLFTLAFWLGYSNSALNPILYAAFSRDFRNAFRKILMRDRSSSLRSSA